MVELKIPSVSDSQQNATTLSVVFLVDVFIYVCVVVAGVVVDLDVAVVNDLQLIINRSMIHIYLSYLTKYFSCCGGV